MGCRVAGRDAQIMEREWMSRCWARVIRGLAQFAVLAAANDTTGPAGAGRVLHVHVREGCPHCADAKVFLETIAPTQPSLRIQFHPVDTDPAARDALIRLSRSARVWSPGVPTFENWAPCC
jgi:glutaredoxin